MSTKNICERCHEIEATKLFFLFADAPPRIEINTRVCDICYVDAGFAEASPSNSETFEMTKMHYFRADYQNEACKDACPDSSTSCF
jgi:hypothetical protein